MVITLFAPESRRPAFSALREGPKRLFLGRPMRSSQLSETLLPKKLAMPVFCSDPLSSVAYATEEILLILSLGWARTSAPCVVCGGRHCRPPRGRDRLLSADLRAYPNGGGAYAVARANLGESAGLAAASALLVDYVLTVAVSVVAGVAAHHVSFSRTIPARRLPVSRFCGAAHSHEPARR